ncbi:hypothetical protein SPRG_12985 [Saprolegnia parasitica CBS 223.65]|uniref:Transmembrane protein n=1 Tax=Saprolegnia parasitica (strain CBS 223.65) TaxID=695850 RepID=A0A067BQU3_SAPPC|nr:hypothetical protein SPRG_12985 [Saprolegnia parasitica CBS 223.65]KDO20628.1 hypothetical protein SPRG_12985 [Saprolegnia parasitica CBS 223.65]|eukprot:XP_012208682.1 hypothetical protein SPRG_12985 [Saprolegnia parasitica CBS 223.65]
MQQNRRKVGDGLEVEAGSASEDGPLRPAMASAMLPVVYLSTEAKDKEWATKLWRHVRHSVLFACTAECVTTCFVPVWAHETTGINVSATLLNIVGPFLEGCAYTLQNATAQDEWKRACRYFRTVFLGVFTSYCYMVDHAGDLVARSAFLGPLYIISTMCYASIAFLVGQRLMHYCIHARKFPRHLPPVQYLWNSLSLFIGIVLVVAVLGPSGFVRDPKDAHFLGSFQVNETLELVVGMLMSCLGIFASMYVGHGRYDGLVDWGAWRCNLASVLFLVLAYGTSYFVPSAVQNVVVAKFVSSFCGSLSCFSTAITSTMILVESKKSPWPH